MNLELGAWHQTFTENTNIVAWPFVGYLHPPQEPPAVV